LQIRYLNTDLDLVSSTTLVPLAQVFETKGFFSLHVEQHDDGHWFATLEIDGKSKEPELTIAAMLSVVEQLDEPEQRTWQSLTLCEFNIGYDCGDEPWAFNQGLSNALLQRVAQVGASIRITLYPPEPAHKTDQD
jgi:hypothetical protein